MAIEFVDFPIKNCDFPLRYRSLPAGYIILTYLDWENDVNLLELGVYLIFRQADIFLERAKF